MYLGVKYEICREFKPDRFEPDSRKVIRVDENGNEETLEVKHTRPYTMKPVTVQPYTLLKVLQSQSNALDEILHNLSQEKGSEWRLFRIIHLFVKGFTIKPMRASSYIPTPESIRTQNVV